MKYSSVAYIFVLILLIGTSLKAQKKSEKQIKNTLAIFFKGLQNGDTITLKKALYKDFRLQSIYTNNEKKYILINASKERFLKSIASKNPTDTWEEKLQSFTIKIDGAMANVWVPYKFYFNEKLSHCGTNSFQMFNDSGTWKIIYIIDTRKKGCSE